MQMEDEKSVQVLAFNFGGRTFAFKRLAQGLNRSPSAINSCVSKHLETCVANYQCFIYFDDLRSDASGGNKFWKILMQFLKAQNTQDLRCQRKNASSKFSRFSFLDTPLRKPA